MLHSTSATVGTFTLYRNTLQTLFVTAEALVHTLRLAFQGVFLMGAFCAATTLKPRLQPEANRAVPYRPGKGMAIEVRYAIGPDVCHVFVAKAFAGTSATPTPATRLPRSIT